MIPKFKNFEKENAMCLGDICLSGGEIAMIVVVIIVILFVLGYAVARSLGDQSTNGILSVDMTPEESGNEEGSDTEYEEVEPEEEVTEEEEYDHPLLVGEQTFAGEYDGLGVNLQILSYDEDKWVVHCRLLVEVPVGASDVDVDHTWEGDDNQLGVALVKFTRDGVNNFVKINLFNDTLVDSDYSVAIQVGSSTTDDITG